MLGLLLLLASLSFAQKRCDQLMNEFKCPYGGRWVKWQQEWSGFRPDTANSQYNKTFADNYYYYDKTWPQKIGDGIDVLVTPPECSLTDPLPGCNPECPRTGNPVPNCPYTKYDLTDKNAVDSSDGKTRLFRPGGFKYGILAIYNQPPVCVCVDNSYDRNVEIAIETLTPNARVCVLDATKADTNSNQNPGEVSDCDEGRFYKCFPSQTDQDLIFRIYCDAGCEDENVELFYRARMSPYRWTVTRDATGYAAGSNPTEMWCDYIPGEEPERMQYPLDIADVVPDNYKLPNQSSAANHVSISTTLVAIGVFVTTLLCL